MTKKIDTHAHLGECCVFGLLATEEDILRRMDECGVDATIVQPYPGATIASKTHDRIADLCARHPGRFFGIASVTPHRDHDAYEREMERCIKDLKFVGIKLHTITPNLCVSGDEVERSPLPDTRIDDRSWLRE